MLGRAGKQLSRLPNKHSLNPLLRLMRSFDAKNGLLLFLNQSMLYTVS
jgi:hypothetical protein